MALKHLLGHVAGALLILAWARRCGAEFTTDFGTAMQGGPLDLKWEGVDPESFPLVLGVSLINKTDGGSVYGLKTDISTTVTDSTFLWPDVPYPARFIPTAMYQVEVRPSHWEGDQQPVLARSPFFSIQKSNPQQTGGPASDPQSPSSDSSATGINTKLAIGLGVSIGIPSLIAGGVVGWCVRKKRRKATQEEKWRKRMEFVIN